MYTNKLYFLLSLTFIFIIYFLAKPDEKLSNIMYYDEDANNLYNMNLDKKLCNGFTCNNDTISNKILLIGKNSNNNHIFKLTDKLYTSDDDKLIIANDTKDLLYYDLPIKVPIDLANMTIKIKLTLDDFDYIGILSNNFYYQQYLLYQKPYGKDSELDYKLYYYKLVKIIDGKYIILYTLPPRAKIMPEESIWASVGSFQIGPLLFN
jgi:hypothetical protein